MNYYEHHLGDYMRDTAHLSMIEDGAYRRLLDAYYAREKPLPLDDRECCKLARAATKADRSAVKYVLQEFFDLREDGYHQKRVDVEIARFHDGEPEREAKKANESNRLRKHREERARLFQALNDAGEHAPWNIGIEDLRKRVERLHATERETFHETAPATPATATHTQYPIPITQEKSKIKNGAAAPLQLPIDPKAALWARWKSMPDGGGGAFLAKLIRDFHDEQRVLEAVERTLDHAPADPKAFIVGMLRKPVQTGPDYLAGAI